MTNTEEKINRIWLKLVNVLLLKNPERTVLGVLLGVVFSFFSKIFTPLLEKIQYIDISKAPTWGWIPLGIVFMNLPVIVSLIRKKPRINEKVDEVTKIIEEGNFSEVERRRMYRNLVSECVKNVSLHKNFAEEFDRIQNDLLKEKS